ncbi:MAG TPA: riboflavin synthase [Clostridiales bacterium]|nr:riboflavin synthase [Clostridiales bacterium]
MFTGIIEETGTIQQIRYAAASALLTVACKKVLEDTKIGDSVAVNGICLTVVATTGTTFTADVMAETLAKTALQQLGNGSIVNLERAMAAGGRFGGHMVSGHIDGVGTILKAKENDIAVIYTIGADQEILDGIVKKGSVALDGISLTVVDSTEKDFSVSLIPHTRDATNFKKKNNGDLVNVETDVIGKYVKKYLKTSDAREKSTEITMDFLGAKGFF